MRALIFAVVLCAFVLSTAPVWAATQYGVATIEQGAMTILREGKTLNFDKPNTPIPVNEEDLVRVRPDSRVVLKSREKATLQLGANAVFHVKPWESREQKGYLRALFGRFRASVVGLTGGEQFNTKTATATIGVKGTELLAQVTPRGDAMLVVTESVVSLIAVSSGASQQVAAGNVSLVTGGSNPTTPAPTPAAVSEQFNEESLDAPEPNVPSAENFTAEEVLVEQGIVTPTQLQQNRGTTAPTPTPTTQSTTTTTTRTTTTPTTSANEGSSAQQRARVPLNFQK